MADLRHDTISDVAYALRNLARNPGFAAVVILTLALGIGGTTAVFSAVDAVLLKPLPFQEPGQLVRVYGHGVQNPGAHNFVTPVHYIEYREQLASLEGLAAILTYNQTGADIGSGDAARRIRTLPTSANYFDVLRVHPTLGRAYQVDGEYGTGIEDNVDGAPMVVLSHDLWEREFRGDPAAIGQSLLMSGRRYEVLGVMPKGFTDPVVGAVDAWVPIDLRQGRDPNEANNHYLSLIGRVRAGVPLAQAQDELDRLSLRLAEQYPSARDERAHFYPLKEDIVGASTSRSLQIMLGAVGFVLLLVCVNVANLMLVRGSERTREFAVRSALGAGRMRIVRQLLAESLTLAVAGALAGLLVARLAMQAIVALGAGNIPRLGGLSFNPWLLVFALVLSGGCAVLFGLTPAIRAARVQPGDALRDQSRANSSGARSLRAREWLVVSQVAIAFVLLVGAGLLLSSFQKISHVELGVHTDGVLTFQLNLPASQYDSTARVNFFESFAEQVAALPGVKAAGGISRLPATGAYHQWGVRALSGPLTGDNDRNGIGGAQNRVVSGDYFRAVGIPVKAGRTFDAGDDSHAPDRVVISQSLAARLFPGTSALGQRLRTGGRESEVIGVVGDVAVTNEGTEDMYVYHAHRQFAGDRNWPLSQVIATTGSPMSLQPKIREILSAADPRLVMYQPALLDEVVGAGAAQRLFIMRILVIFAAIALALSALGLFGVLSYGVKLRAREFGIRMALGAQRQSIGAMVMRQAMTVVAVGVAIGLAAALPLSRLMAALLFRVSPLDPRVIAGSIAFTVLVAAVAAYLPAHRATGVNPRSIMQ